MQNHAGHLKLLAVAVVGFVALAAFGVPVLSYLPFLLILVVCPLMMVLMMRGMDHSGPAKNSDDRDSDLADRIPTAHKH